MVEPLRHRQTKGAETDMPGLPPPRHIPTLPVTISPIARLLASQMMVHLGVENPFGQGLLQIVVIIRRLIWIG